MTTESSAHTRVPSETEGPTPHRATLPVILLSLATVISAVSSLMVALPSVAVATHATQTELTWIVDAYSLTFAVLLLPCGALGDRFGRRRVLLAGMAIFVVVSFVPLFTSSATLLIAVRALLGLGAALVMPATLSTITATFPAVQRTRAIATWAGVAGAGAILGLFAAGLAIQWWSWREVFVVSGVLAFVSLAGTFRWVPESAAPDEASRDALGALLSAAGLAAIVFAVIEAPTKGLATTSTIVELAVGALVLVAFLLWEGRAARPLLAPRYFGRGGFSTGALSLTVQFFGFFGFIMVFLQKLQLVHGYGALLAATAMLPLPFGIMPAARGLAPRVARRLPQARQSGLGLLLMGASVGALSRTGADAPYWQLGLGLWVLGVGAGLAMPPATTAITRALPAGEQGVASAMNDLSRELGGAVGIAVLSSVLTGTYRGGLDLSIVPERFRGLVQSSGPAAIHAPDPRIAGMASRAYLDGIQQALLVGSAVLLVTSLALLAASARRPSRPEHT